MSAMGLPLQAHTNVRDVLAPLFCNGSSFSSLIDELSRHFKFEQLASDAAHDDTTGALEASSESQSTDSEAEVRRLASVVSRRSMFRMMHPLSGCGQLSLRCRCVHCGLFFYDVLRTNHR